MKCQKALALLAIAGVVSISPLAAQQKTQTQTRQPTTRSTTGESASRSADQRTNWKDADHLLATCVAIDNQEEIAIARFAEKKLQDKEAQEFARMLIEDHGEFVKKLEQFAPEATQDGFLTESRTTRERASGDRSDNDARTSNRTTTTERTTQSDATRKQANQGNQAKQTRQQTTTTERTTAKPNLNAQGAGGMPIDFLQLHRELAQQCLNDTQEMLNDKSEDEIDQCFIGLQIAKHAAMKSKLEVLQRHASGELKDLLAQGEKTTTSHLEHAQKIIKRLADSSDRRSDSK